MQTIVSLNMFSILNVRHKKLDFAQPLKGNRDSDTAVRDRELHFLRIETPRIAENKMIKTNTYNSIYNQCSTTFRNEDNSLCCTVAIKMRFRSENATEVEHWLPSLRGLIGMATFPLHL